MRCFVALGWDPDTMAPVVPWLESAGRFRELAVSPPRNLHLTLAFLGEVGEEQVTAAAEALAEVGPGARPWSLAWGKPGAFPSLARARVLWMGVDDAGGRLAALRAQLVSALAARGLDRADHPFRPHLTLARVRSGLSREVTDRLQQHLAEVPPPRPAEVRSLVLYRSRLGRGPAVHEVLAEVPLG